MYVYIYVYIDRHMYTHIYICMYIYIYPVALRAISATVPFDWSEMYQKCINKHMKKCTKNHDKIIEKLMKNWVLGCLGASRGGSWGDVGPPRAT